MANILGIFTAIILAVAAFVALKNNDRLDQERVNRANEEKKLEQTQALLAEVLAELKVLPIKRAEVVAQIVSKTGEETGLKESIDATKKDIEAKQAQIEDSAKELDAFREKVAKVGSIRELAPKMRAMHTDLEALTQGIEDKEVEIANLTADANSTGAAAKKIRDKLDLLSRGESLPSLKTSIRSIYPSWGFVTLNSGNNAGVASNSTLKVVRDGATIAKLLVTSVESSSASASIIPDSISQEITLMVGDRVISASASEAAVQN